jgi:autoinducer 2-degrading protein
MFHVAGYFDVPAAHRTAFIDAALEDAHASLSSETGTRRFEVIQDVDNANRFYLDEVYDDAATFEAHVRGPHFKKFFDVIEELAVEWGALIKGTDVTTTPPRH